MWTKFKWQRSIISAGTYLIIFRLFTSYIFWRRNWSSSRWYEQRLEEFLNVLTKFLLLTTFSQASQSVESRLEGTHPLVAAEFSFRFAVGSTPVVFDWAVFDLVSGVNTLQDVTKRFFRWIALRLLGELSCVISPVGTLSLVLVLHCPPVVHTDRVSCVTSPVGILSLVSVLHCPAVVHTDRVSW